MRSLFVLIALCAVACSPASQPTTAPLVFSAGDPPATPGPLDGSDGALGSGCTASQDQLPDGAWFGYATAWDTTGMEFDLACFYSGDAAAAQASARNEESPPPNDYYLVNEATTTQHLDVAAGTAAYRTPDGGVGLERTTYAELIATTGPSGSAICPGESCTIWVFVNDGRVTEVMWQFFP